MDKYCLILIGSLKFFFIASQTKKSPIMSLNTDLKSYYMERKKKFFFLMSRHSSYCLLLNDGFKDTSSILTTIANI